MSEETKYTVRQLADALGVSQEAVRKRAKNNGWHYEETTGIGGKRRLYPFGALPVEVQAQLLKHTKPKTTKVSRPAASRGVVDRESLRCVCDHQQIAERAATGSPSPNIPT